jgi:hypothetical protein
MDEAVPTTCHSQLGVTAPAYETYASAAALLWGEAGQFAAAEFARINREHFAGSIPPVPIIIAMTPYGCCIGLTGAPSWLASPRISLAPEIFTGSRERLDPRTGRMGPGRIHGGPRQVSDTLVHELIHAALILRGENPEHNADPWCKLITELSPDLLGVDITARPVRTHRVPNPARETDPKAPKTIVRRMPEPGCLAQMDLARWPHSLRPPGWHDGDRPIYVPAC